MFRLKLNKYEQCSRTWEVVGRGRETQLQVRENLSKLIQQDKC